MECRSSYAKSPAPKCARRTRRLTSDAAILELIKPGAYPVDPKNHPENPTWIRPPHIHFDVTGKTSRLVTQMYFEGEALNEKDLLLQGLGARGNKESVIAKLRPPTKDLEPESLLIAWDIILENG
jgi:protocatechuate 3,4-dioxygenase, beta subunit